MYIYCEKGLKTVRKKHGTKNLLFDFFSWKDRLDIVSNHIFITQKVRHFVFLTCLIGSHLL